MSKGCLPIALKLGISCSQQALSREKHRMLQRRRSDVKVSKRRELFFKKPAGALSGQQNPQGPYLRIMGLDTVWCGGEQLAWESGSLGSTQPCWASGCGGLWSQVVWVQRRDGLFSHCVTLGNLVHLPVPQSAYLRIQEMMPVLTW